MLEREALKPVRVDEPDCSDVVPKALIDDPLRETRESPRDAGGQIFSIPLRSLLRWRTGCRSPRGPENPIRSLGLFLGLHASSLRLRGLERWTP